MNPHCRPRRALRWALPFVLALGPASAQAAAGQVLFALGRVEIQRGEQTFAAQRGAPVEIGDTISTGPTGLAQVRLRDGALLSLRHGSTMKVEDFQLPQPAAAPVTPGAPATGAAAAGGRSVLRLLRGAFRTVTGLIGKSAGDSYSVITPVATIGIRGTDYSAAYCSGDCGKTPDGLYVGVSNGAVALSNAGGELVLSNDQYAYVKDGATAPDQELAPPEVLETPIAPEDDGEEGEGGDEAVATAARDAGPEGSFRDESGTAGSFETGAGQPEGDYELRPGDFGSYAYGAPGHNGSNEGGLFVDDARRLTGFLDGELTNIGTAQHANQGFDSATGLRWGRWENGVATVGASSLDLTNASLHWIYGPTADRATLPISGTRSYTLVGNTNPTDNANGVGFLGDAILNANFTSMTVDSSVTVGFGDVAGGTGTLWQASGSGSILAGSATFDGSYSSVTVNGDATATAGFFAGFFTPGADAAGLAFELSQGSTVVSGAAAFEVDTTPPAAAGAP